MKAEQLLRQLGIPFLTSGNHHCRPGWLQLQCPFCGSRAWHLGYNLRWGYLNCYRCGKHPRLDYVSYCYDCYLKQQRDWRAANREHYNAYRREQREIANMNTDLRIMDMVEENRRRKGIA